MIETTRSLKNFVITDEMRKHSQRDISRRSLLGCIVYLLVWFAIIIPNNIYVDYPRFSFWTSLFFIVMAGVRIGFIFNFEKIYPANKHLWFAVFYPLIWLPALVWGLLCAYSFLHPDMIPYSLVIIISTAGMAGGGVAALLPSRLLTVGLFSCFLLPGIIVLYFFEHNANVSMGLVFIIYALGMYTVTRIQHREYWMALKDSFLIKKHADELAILNTLDGLTNLKNRFFFDTYLQKEIKSASRLQMNLALLLIDIDYFKPINDRFGHLAGDACLKSLAALMKKKVKRETDIIARYGGEEFAIILPDTNREQAMAIAEQLRKTVKEHPIQYGDITIPFTISIGVTSMVPDHDTTKEQLIAQADTALYRAKTNGRNQVGYN